MNFINEDIINVAEASDGYPHKHASFLINKKGQIFNAASNDKRSHSEVSTISRFVSIHKNRGLSIQKIKKKLSQYILVNIRISKSRKLLNSRPCYHCLNVIKSSGIRIVYYSMDDNLVEERVNCMETSHISSFYKNKCDVQFETFKNKKNDFSYFINM